MFNLRSDGYVDVVITSNLSSDHLLFPGKTYLAPGAGNVVLW